jgi:photosystem II stability/assembly factor-like uncharacterized protein
MNPSYAFTLTIPVCKQLLALLTVFALWCIPLHAQVMWEPANNGLEGGLTNSWTFGSDGEVYASVGNNLYRLNQDRSGWILQNDSLRTSTLVIARDGALLKASTNIMRSEDGGVSWKIVLTPKESIMSMSMAPDGSIWATSYSCIYRSEDNGQTWMTRTLPEKVMQISFDTRGRALAAGYKGIYRTEDSGRVWSRITSPAYNNYPISIVETSSGDLLSAGVYYQRSTDDGATWVIEDSLPVRQFAVAPNGDIYAAVIDEVDFTNSDGVYRSTDGGKTWISRITLRPDIVAVAPNGDVWVVTGNRILRSQDNGEHWKVLPTGIAANTVGGVLADRSGNLFVTVVSGYRYYVSGGNPTIEYYSLHRSTDNGDSWELLKDSLFYSGIQIDSMGGLYVADFNRNVLNSTDQGESWAKFSGSDMLLLSSNRNGVIAFTTRSYNQVGELLSVSSDGGSTWYHSELQQSIHSLLVTPDNTILIASRDLDKGEYGLYRSTDYGHSLNQLDDTLYMDLAVSPSGDVFGIGPTWLPGNGGRSLYRLSSDGTERRVLLDSTGLWSWKFGGDGVIFLDGSSRSYRSTDGGEEWSPLAINGRVREVRTGSNRKDIYSLYMDSVAKIHIYKSSDKGSSWANVSAGIRDNVTSMAIGHGDRLFAGTEGRGVLRTAKPASAPAISGQRPSALQLGQNIPNPFNSTTTIPFVLPQQQHVTVKVHDLLGREVAILANGVIPGGENTVQFKASGMASGVYVVTLNGDWESASRLIIVR